MSQQKSLYTNDDKTRALHEEGIYKQWRKQFEKQNALAHQAFLDEMVKHNARHVRQSRCNHFGMQSIYGVSFGVCPLCGMSGLTRSEAISVAMTIYSTPPTDGTK